MHINELNNKKVETIQDLAGNLFECFEEKTRQGVGNGSYWALRDDLSEEVSDDIRNNLIMPAHDDANILPNDHIYDMITDCISAISDGLSIDDLEPWIYNNELKQWFKECPNAIDYCNQAIIEFGAHDDIMKILSSGQLLQLQDIYSIVEQFLFETMEKFDNGTF